MCPHEFVHKMDAASLLCGKGLVALHMFGFETYIALFLQDT